MNASGQDFLDEVVAERTAEDQRFPGLLKAAERRRQLLRAFADCRRRGGQTQTAIAAAMQSSQSTVARLETTATDARISTLDRYAGVLGYRVQYHLVPLESGGADRPVVVHPRSRAA